EAPDELTLEIKLRAPSNTFLYLLAAPYAFPWPKHRCEALGEAWREPANLVGNGPYVLSEVTDDHVILRARERWHGARGNVEEFSISLKPLGSRYADVWRGGGVDLFSTNVEFFTDDDATAVEVAPALATWYLGFRAAEPPFDDARVRRAFALTIDRDRMA